MVLNITVNWLRAERCCNGERDIDAGERRGSIMRARTENSTVDANFGWLA